MARRRILQVGHPDPPKPAAVGVRRPAVRGHRHLPERRLQSQRRRPTRSPRHIVCAGGDRRRHDRLVLAHAPAGALPGPDLPVRAGAVRRRAHYGGRARHGRAAERPDAAVRPGHRRHGRADAAREHGTGHGLRRDRLLRRRVLRSPHADDGAGGPPAVGVRRRRGRHRVLREPRLGDGCGAGGARRRAAAGSARGGGRAAQHPHRHRNGGRGRPSPVLQSRGRAHPGLQGAAVAGPLGHARVRADRARVLGGDYGDGAARRQGDAGGGHCAAAGPDIPDRRHHDDARGRARRRAAGDGHLHRHLRLQAARGAAPARRAARSGGGAVGEPGTRDQKPPRLDPIVGGAARPVEARPPRREVPDRTGRAGERPPVATLVRVPRLLPGAGHRVPAARPERGSGRRQGRPGDRPYRPAGAARAAAGGRDREPGVPRRERQWPRHPREPADPAVRPVRDGSGRRHRPGARDRAARRGGASRARAGGFDPRAGDHLHRVFPRRSAERGSRMTQQPSILVVDDELGILDVLRILLKGEGFDVVTAQGGKAGLEALKAAAPDIVLTDIKMPGVSGTDILAAVREQDPETPVILMTAQASLQSAIQAVNQGAFYYIQKPFSNDDLVAICRRAAEQRLLKAENKQLKQEIRRRERSGLVKPLGKSRPFQEVLKLAEQVAPTESTVLIQGESGTGKEVIARYIHELSARADGGFFSLNCGALPESLLESELFGHVKGSFTGAVRDKQGLFAAARGGTFFLDEIGEMSPATQVKLLRVLQEREAIPVGGTEAIPVDVRVVAATNRDLEDDIKRGRFRTDLYYRLNVIAMHLPPLRDRRDDIQILCDEFLGRIAQERGEKPKPLSQEAQGVLLAYDWPGNVRELENAVERAVVLSKGDTIDLAALPEKLTERRAEPLVAERPHLNPTLDVIERAYITWVLQSEGGNKTRAAEVLGIDPSTLYRKLSRYEGDVPG